MLVLSRKPGETVVIGSDIRLKVLRIQGGRVRIGIDAPGDVAILREELSQWSEPPADRGRCERASTALA